MLRVCVCFGLMGLSLAVHAQPAPSKIALIWMRARISENIQRAPYSWSYEQVGTLVEPVFLAVSTDGVRITAEDRALYTRETAALVRGNLLSPFLTADLDANGRVDRGMMRKAMSRLRRGGPPAAEKQIETTIETFFRAADADRDGVVTYEEAARWADTQFAARNSLDDPAMPPVEFDLDGDGTVTIEEFRAVIRAVYAEIDTDGDGRISQTEVASFIGGVVQNDRREAQAQSLRSASVAEARQRAMVCGVPAWASGSVLSVVLAGEEKAVVDASIGEGSEQLGAVNVHVEPGSRKVSVALGSPHPTIWQFTGDTGRVASVFVSQDAPAARPASYAVGLAAIAPARPVSRSGSGVTGIEREKVRFAREAGCLPLSAEGNEPLLRDRLVAALGREPDVVVGPSTMSTTRLPSGTALADGLFPNAVGAPTGSAGAPLWAMLEQSKRALVHVDPTSVTAAMPVRSAPLPGIAGLAEMVDDGRAKIAAWHTVTRFAGPRGQVGPTIVGGNGNARITVGDTAAKTTHEPSEILVLAAITLPVGLEDSGIERLVVARGVPLPLGDRRAICIVREEDGRPVDGSRCR